MVANFVLESSDEIRGFILRQVAVRAAPLVHQIGLVGRLEPGRVVTLAAPFAENLRGNRLVVGALNAVTAAVVGVILNLAVWFSLHTVFREVRSMHGPGFSVDVPVIGSLDPAALLLSLAAILATLRFGAGLATVLGGCAAAGFLLYLAGYATG